ncbi:MAG: sugar ABC transporter substrate-binding protein [Chloroflexota bacterium]|nr:sugar ABC transporter substrate-binding protein [Chloroflexota bacterium]
MTKDRVGFDAALRGRLSRRELVRRAAVAGAVPALYGARGSWAATAAQDQNLEATLTLWGWQAALDGLKVVDADFTAAYPRITLEYVERPPADTYQQLQLAASAGSGGPDVSVIEDSHLAQFVQLGVLADLTDRVAPYVEKVNDYRWLQARSDDRIYAMPWDSGPVAVFYRRDVFEEAGVDPASITTWEDYYQAAKTIKAQAGASMLAQATARNSGRTFEMLLWQRGLGYIDQEGNVILDTEPRVQETLEYLGRFWAEDLAADTEEWTDPWYKEMADGTVASIPGAVWMGTFLKSFIAPDAGGQWGVFRLPKWGEEPSQASNDGGSTLAILETSEQKDAAWAYVEFHLGREASQLMIYKETDLFPALETTYTDPFFEEPDPYFADQPVRSLFTEIVAEVPDAGVYSAEYQEMNGLLTPELQRYAAGEQDATAALKNAADAIRERTQRS